MINSTNEILLKIDDGDIIERKGVVYVEETTRHKGVKNGVVIQYMKQEKNCEPRTEFIEDVKLVGVYDEICKENLTDEYKKYTEI